MIKNYLKIAFRALVRSKAHSLINITGLALGIASCLLIVLFVKDELTFDTFHSRADRIYRVYAIEDWGENQKFFDTTTPYPMGPTLKENYSEVEAAVRINPIGSQVKFGAETFSQSVTVVGDQFLNVFDFKTITGDRENALKDMSSTVITESTARKYFGEASAIGKTLSMMIGDRFEEFTVKAVLEDPPSNSSITFQVLIPDSNFPKFVSERTLTSAWFNISPETYVLLKEGTDPKTLEKKFPTLFKTLLADNYEKSKYFVGLQPLTAIHLDTTFPVALAPVSDPKYSYILSAIASLILIVACINFITLSIGRSLKRAKEVGIRKVVGAQRRQLIFQFIGEAVIVTFFALVVGVVLAFLLLPFFNDLAAKQLVLEPDAFLFGVIASLILVIGMFAGSYPAFVLSGFKPISILKGNIKSGDSKQRMRKVLVGLQLVLSIFLISSTLLMYKQLRFLQNKNLGFSRDQMAVVQLNVQGNMRLRERIAAGFAKVEQFKSELNRIPGVVAVCGSSHDFGNGTWTNLGYTDDKGTYRTFNTNIVDDEYVPVMKMELREGRNFSDENPSDAKRSIIVNESFVKSLGWESGVGKRIPGKNFTDHEIIGVVKDFNYASLYTKVDPLVMTMDPNIPLSGSENINIGNSPVPKLMIRLRAGEIAPAIEQVKGVWDKLTGGEEFNFDFVDESLAAQYRADQNLGRIVSSASLLAIFIGSLGLYALASLALQNRTKEISIRKVMGATEESLLVLLSKEYLLLVAVCLLISVPITWYLMSSWLSTFEYRVGIGPDTFLAAGAIALVIALLTVSYQILKTAWTQPAKTLKYE